MGFSSSQNYDEISLQDYTKTLSKTLNYNKFLRVLEQYHIKDIQHIFEHYVNNILIKIRVPATLSIKIQKYLSQNILIKLTILNYIQ